MELFLQNFVEYDAKTSGNIENYDEGGSISYLKLHQIYKLNKNSS